MSKPQPFVEYLQKLKGDEQRGRTALAALRRGLGQPPGQAPEMFRYVTPFIPTDAGVWQEECYFLIASLFGLHPESTEIGNMGDHYSRLRQSADDAAVERRFMALLAAHPDDLDTYLRQAVSLLKSKDVPVNWSQLLWDVLAWNDPDRRLRVTKAWARAFWKGPSEEDVPLPDAAESLSEE